MGVLTPALELFNIINPELSKYHTRMSRDGIPAQETLIQAIKVATLLATRFRSNPKSLMFLTLRFRSCSAKMSQCQKNMNPRRDCFES